MTTTMTTRALLASVPIQMTLALLLAACAKDGEVHDAPEDALTSALPDDNPMLLGGACPPPPVAATAPGAECQAWPRGSAPALRGRLAVTYVADPAKPEGHEIGTLDLGRPGASIVRLTNNDVNESEIDVSPDGKSILYTVRPELDAFGDAWEVHQIGFDGSSPRVLIRSEERHPYGGGSIWMWPGEGAGQLAFMQRGGGETDRGEFLVFDLASQTTRPLLVPATPTSHPAELAHLLQGELGDHEVSYDGALMTFKSSGPGDRDEQPSIYVLELRSGKLRRLTQCWSDHDPVFSRDGKKVYFERYYGPGHWFIDESTMTTRPDGTDVDETGVPIGPWRYQWGIVEVDIATREERVIVPPDPCGRYLPWLPTVSPSADVPYLMYTVNDLGAWADDGKVTGPTGEAWVSDLRSLERSKVPGTDWVHFLDWTE